MYGYGYSTFNSFAVALTSFLHFQSGLIGLLLCPLQIVLGNVIVRIAYEFSIMLVLITKNTTEINAKMKSENGEVKSDIFSAPLLVIEKKAKPAAPAAGAKFCSGCGKKCD